MMYFFLLRAFRDADDTTSFADGSSLRLSSGPASCQILVVLGLAHLLMAAGLLWLTTLLLPPQDSAAAAGSDAFSAVKDSLRVAQMAVRWVACSLCSLFALQAVNFIWQGILRRQRGPGGTRA